MKKEKDRGKRIDVEKKKCINRKREREREREGERERTREGEGIDYGDSKVGWLTIYILLHLRSLRCYFKCRLLALRNSNFPSRCLYSILLSICET